jgi:glycine cleavage system transcriptional repressor
MHYFTIDQYHRGDTVMSDHYLVISALGKDRPGIVNTLSKAAFDCGCNLTDSRMAVLGGEFALILLIHGSQTAITEMERRLPALERELTLTIIAKPTALRVAEQHWLPYRVRVMTIDNPGIVQAVTEFFSTRKINIEEMETGTYPAPLTGATLFSLQMTVAVPASAAINTLREDFVDFCENLNLDASFEAARD